MVLDPVTAPLGLGGIVLAVERGLALWRQTRPRPKGLVREDVDEIVRDALSLHAERMENLFVDALGETRRELADQMRDLLR